MANKDSIKMVVTFAARGHGKALTELYAEQGVNCTFQCMGRGTASSDLLDVLGLGTTEKDILICLASRENTYRLMGSLEDGLKNDIYGSGIVFSMSVTGLNNLIAAVFLNEEQRERGGRDIKMKTDYSLILITVNQGHTDAVMDTAREAGAGGGTVIRARWAGNEENNQFYGISVQAEKEIIAIVASGERRNTIMEVINKKHGLKTEAGAAGCSLGLEQTVKF